MCAFRKEAKVKLTVASAETVLIHLNSLNILLNNVILAS